MSNIAKSSRVRTSRVRAALRYRMPAMRDDSLHGHSSTVEQQTCNLRVAGSNPVFRPLPTHPCTGLYSRLG